VVDDAGFFDALPVELEEAARLDGVGNLGAFFRVALPLAKPGLVAAGVFSFFMCINEFLFVFIIAPTRVRPVSVAVTLFLPTGIRATMYGEACAAAILIALPGLTVALLMQGYLIRGMTFGALK
jgi:ABC-type glycerol-3-phosphate transport system permease component